MIEKDSNMIPDDWVIWFNAGWHGISAIEWATIWLPNRLESELQILKDFTRLYPKFSGVGNRITRDIIDHLIRSQYHLPWASKKMPPFCRQIDASETNNDLEHPIPVLQLRNYVALAINEGNIEEAKKRLQLSWLIPMALISKSTHRNITKGESRLCEDFNYPFSRYSDIKIKLYNDKIVNPSKYTLEELISDLSKIEYISPIIDKIKDVRVKMTEDEMEEIKKAPDRKGHPRRSKRKTSKL